MNQALTAVVVVVEVQAHQQPKQQRPARFTALTARTVGIVSFRIGLGAASITGLEWGAMCVYM